MKTDFADQVVLITGVGQSIGRALAAAFAVRGAIVAVNALTPIHLDETVARIQKIGGQAQAYVADISSKLALQTMLNVIMDEYGRIDILINNSGTDPLDALLEMDEWDWRRTVDINLTGPFLLMQSVGRLMQAQEGGTMINLVSMNQNSAAAMASKSGLIGLTQAAARQFGAYNISVNAVCSGVPRAAQRDDLPEDVLELVPFLCRPEAAKITGQVLAAQFESA